jgi:metal-dependent amidase/aminoacylase/carboxypeptidase family protein
MEKSKLKALVLEAIDKNQAEIIEVGRKIWANPELGYKEFKTAQVVKDVFTKYGVKYRSEIARTGVIGELPGRSQEAKVAVLGELDAIIVYEHPNSNKETGAVHA